MVTMSPANMLAQRRTVNESTRARWLTISMGNIKIDSGTRMNRDMLESDGPRKCCSVVCDSLFADSLDVVVHEGADRASQRNKGTAVGDSKPGINPIRLQIRMKKARVIRKGVKPLAVMSDNFLALIFDKTVGAFKDVLQGARLVHGQPGAHQEKQHHQK